MRTIVGVGGQGHGGVSTATTTRSLSSLFSRSFSVDATMFRRWTSLSLTNTLLRHCFQKQQQQPFNNTLLRMAFLACSTIVVVVSTAATEVDNNKPKVARGGRGGGGNKQDNTNHGTTAALAEEVTYQSDVSAATTAAAPLSIRTLETLTRLFETTTTTTTTQLEAAEATTTTTTTTSSKKTTDKDDKDDNDEDEDDNDTTLLLNWSGTHSMQVQNKLYWEPESIAEVEQIVATCHARGQTLRPIGSALSPNGLAFFLEQGNQDEENEDEENGTNRVLPSKNGLLSLSNLDQILSVNCHDQLVTVQAGARVEQVIQALKPYNMTLPNLASIAEQQMGGFIQVGAHGTGRTLAPVDHYVTQLKLVTPGLGTIVLRPSSSSSLLSNSSLSSLNQNTTNKNNNDQKQQDMDNGTRETKTTTKPRTTTTTPLIITNDFLFHMVKVGLGCLGIVVEVTMKCIPSHNLVEHTFCLSRQEAQKQLQTLLQNHLHVRYMWIPYTDTVVVVTNDMETHATTKSLVRLVQQQEQKQQEQTTTFPKRQEEEEERFRPLRQLLVELSNDNKNNNKTNNQQEEKKKL